MIGVFVGVSAHARHAHRLTGYVIQESGCWDWVGKRMPRGYGKLIRHGREYLAHRYFYEQACGPVPAGLELDHLCRNPSCVNPAHLEPVSHRVNVLRGDSRSAANAAKTHCVNGHPLDIANTYHWRNQRHCRQCGAVRTRRYKRERA